MREQTTEYNKSKEKEFYKQCIKSENKFIKHPIKSIEYKEAQETNYVYPKDLSGLNIELNKIL